MYGARVLGILDFLQRGYTGVFPVTTVLTVNFVYSKVIDKEYHSEVLGNWIPDYCFTPGNFKSRDSLTVLRQVFTSKNS